MDNSAIREMMAPPVPKKRPIGFARGLDQLEARTDAKFQAVFDAIRQLMATPEPRKHSIGFVTPKYK